MSFYSTMKFLLAGLIRKLWRVEIIGAENERDGVPYLICANHQSMLDVVILGASIKNNPKYMAKKELLKVPLVGGLVKALGAYPVDRKNSDVAAIKKTINLLKDGYSVTMFPQGTRYKGIDPKTTRIKHGCAMIAQRANVAVLPVYIKAKGYRLRLFRKTKVIIGKEISIEEINSASISVEDHKGPAELIFSRITELGDSV